MKKNIHILALEVEHCSFMKKDSDFVIVGVYDSEAKAKANAIPKMQEYIADYYYKGNLLAQDISPDFKATYKEGKTTVHLSAVIDTRIVE